MKIGIIGLGSIGRRHASVLMELGGNELFALRSKKGQLKSLEEKYSSIKELYELKDFLAEDLDGIIISTPTSLHVPNILDVISKRIPLLVEKPLAGFFDQISEVPVLARPLIRTAYCLRFHVISQRIKEWISNGELGRPLKANLVVGQYLPTWHEYADYRKEYYSRSELGGGALKTLSHELDLALFWFGDFKKLAASVRKVSNLEIDVDDNSFVLGEHSSGVVSNISMDFLASKTKRNGTIVFEKGELSYDFVKKQLEIYPYEGKQTISEKIEDKDFYREQMLDFIQFIKDGTSQNSTFEQASHIMNVIDNAEKFSSSDRWIKVN